MWQYNRDGKRAIHVVAYGGQDPRQQHRKTPLGVCDRVLQGKQSFSVGKILRMGHYAVILQPYFRLNRKGRSARQ